MPLTKVVQGAYPRGTKHAELQLLMPSVRYSGTTTYHVHVHVGHRLRDASQGR